MSKRRSSHPVGEATHTTTTTIGLPIHTPVPPTATRGRRADSNELVTDTW
ncbi:MAG: hypothetical protein U1U88_002199 [Lawsonella clevelandensis]